ncbi:MAG: polysaccharide biosynthesis C-terminal domain-containing protein, partial [Bacteroidales bacterium]|nr:polysaccharide biosynthesis C-terminal domain-containing protein [Bacteroidales bacterium]
IILTIEFCVLSSGYIYSYKKHVGEINKWKYDKDIAKYILKESFPLLLSGAAVVIYQRIDQVLIGNMIDLESVGYFATANKFLDIILFLPVIITQSVTPLLIRIKERNIHEYNIKKEQFVSIVVWGTVLISTITFFCSEWLINITFGKNYLLAIPVLKILVWKTVGMALLITTGQLVIIEHIQKYAFIRNIIGLCVSVVLNLVFIPKYGIIGSAYVTLITIAFTSCLANVFIKPYHNMFKLQLRVIFLGWKEFFKIKSFLRSQNN